MARPLPLFLVTLLHFIPKLIVLFGSLEFFCLIKLYVEGDRRAGGVQEAGNAILKVAGSGRNKENYATLCNNLQSKKCKEVGRQQK